MVYVDHGNSGTVEASSLRPIDHDMSLRAIPPLAHECELAFVKVPELAQEWGRDGAMLLNDVAWGRDVVAKVHAVDPDGNRPLVTIYDESGEHADTSVNEMIVSEGLGRINVRQQRDRRLGLSLSPQTPPTSKWSRSSSA